MVLVRSVMIETWTPAGRDSSSCGSSCFTRSTTPMTLAPGWRWMFMITAGVVSFSAPSWVFSDDCTTSATSARRIGAPLR